MMKPTRDELILLYMQKFLDLDRERMKIIREGGREGGREGVRD